jgi:hypothetical protein
MKKDLKSKLLSLGIMLLLIILTAFTTWYIMKDNNNIESCSYSEYIPQEEFCSFLRVMDAQENALNAYRELSGVSVVDKWDLLRQELKNC